MAMTMTGEVQLPARREVVYAKLNDPEVLKACIPGCEELNKTSDTEFQAVATTKIGPVKARFKGKVHLTDLDPPNGYRISGEGEGGVAGFAKGGATVALSEKDGGTLLTYNVEAQIGGKLAQLGQRLVNGAAKKIADDFFGISPRPSQVLSEVTAPEFEAVFANPLTRPASGSRVIPVPRRTGKIGSIRPSRRRRNRDAKRGLLAPKLGGISCQRCP